MLSYNFIIEISEMGGQMPFIHFNAVQHSFLKQLVYTQKLQTSKGVKIVLAKIENVLNGTTGIEEIWETECELPCYLEIRKEISIIGDAYAQSDDLEFKVNTNELKIMFEKWLKFLQKYENNEIPNLKYDFKAQYF